MFLTPKYHEEIHITIDFWFLFHSWDYSFSTRESPESKNLNFSDCLGKALSLRIPLITVLESGLSVHPVVKLLVIT